MPMQSSRLKLIPIAALLATAASAQTPAAKMPAPPAASGAEFPRDTYATLGSTFASDMRLADLGWTSDQFDAFVEGMRAAYAGRPRAVDARAQLLHQRVEERLQALVAQEEQSRFNQAGSVDKFIREAAKKLRLEIADSGLAYAMAGDSGNRPAPEDTVVLSYQVFAPDLQTEFPDLGRKEARVKIADLIPGLAEGVQMMTVSGSGMFIMPPELTFPADSWPEGVARGAPLAFVVKLHQIVP